jgi:hypothetical protein
LKSSVSRSSIVSLVNVAEASLTMPILARLQRSTSSWQFGLVRRRGLLAPLIGFGPRSATSTSEPGLPEFASLSTFPSRTFSAPQGFASRWLSRPYFMPRPPVGFSPSESSPPLTAVTISGPLPS